MEKDKEALKREADDARSATDGLVRDKVKKTGRKKNAKKIESGILLRFSHPAILHFLCMGALLNPSLFWSLFYFDLCHLFSFPPNFQKIYIPEAERRFLSYPLIRKISLYRFSLLLFSRLSFRHFLYFRYSLNSPIYLLLSLHLVHLHYKHQGSMLRCRLQGKKLTPFFSLVYGLATERNGKRQPYLRNSMMLGLQPMRSVTRR